MKITTLLKKAKIIITKIIILKANQKILLRIFKIFVILVLIKK